MIKKIFVIFIFTVFINHSNAKESIMILKLKDGDVVIELFNDIAPNHVARFINLSKEKKYDGVVFHRVIDGFMAQTGDIQFGNSNSENFDLSLAGTGGSGYPILTAEPFSKYKLLDECIEVSFFIIPPCGLSLDGLSCFFIILIPSTITLSLSG